MLKQKDTVVLFLKKCNGISVDNFITKGQKVIKISCHKKVTSRMSQPDHLENPSSKTIKIESALF